MRELKLWIYSGQVLGQYRVILVADYTVGGAKERLGGHYGSPSTKNAVPASAPGFPCWVDLPGTWIGIVPAMEGPHQLPDLMKGLDRYSQDAKGDAPKVLPANQAAFVPGKTVAQATNTLGELLHTLLITNYDSKVLKAR